MASPVTAVADASFSVIVNYRNKWTFTNSSALREGSKVPLTSGTSRFIGGGI